MPRIPRARVAGHATLLTRVYWMYEVRYVRGARVSVLSLASYTQHTGPLSHPTVPLSHGTGHWHWPLESLEDGGGWRRILGFSVQTLGLLLPGEVVQPRLKRG